MYRVQYGKFGYFQFNTGKNHISNDDEQEQTVSLPGERVMRVEKLPSGRHYIDITPDSPEYTIKNCITIT